METTPLVVIVGETASGKSELALQLAQQFNGELICADSRTIYKHLNIGTAKPTKPEQQQIPHHLLDICEPNQIYTAAQFKEDAQKAIEDISARGKLPIMVGGTGLYIDAVIFDYQFQPPNARRRAELSHKSLEELQAVAKKIGISSEDIDFQNRRHLQRAVEAGRVGKQPRKLRSKTLVLGLQLPREVLQQRITQRVNAMIKNGFIDELTAVSQQFGWDSEAMTGIGYKAFRSYIEGNSSLEDAKAAFIKGDLQLAKRQRTWFKRNKSIHWLDKTIQALPLVSNFLNKVDSY